MSILTQRKTVSTVAFWSALFVALELSAQDVSDRVVVSAGQAEIMIDGNVVDKVVFGQVFQVHAVQGDWLWVRYRRSGWIGKANVIPIAQAVTYFNELIRVNPQAASYYHARGNVWGHLGQLDNAVADFSSAIRLDQNRAASYNNRALARQNQGKFDEAIADYEAAIRLDLSNPITYCNRAWVWHAKGQFQKAVDDYTEAIRLDAKYVHSYSNRGMTYSAMGEFGKALKDYDQAIALDPKNAGDYNNRAWLRCTCPDAQYRDGKMALADAKKACELSDWKVPRYVDTLAVAHAETGNFVRAIRWLRRAMESAQDDARKKTREKMLEAFLSGRTYRESISQ